VSLTYKDITEILKIIDASDCQELVLEVGDTKLVVHRKGSSPPSPSLGATPAASSAPPEEPETSAAAPQASAISASALGTEVRAPMVGTFFRKPSPTEPSFVEIGQFVRKGDPLCLIEIMKLYTTIDAPVSGKVAAIGADDEELVAHNQVLFVIEPS